MAASRKRTGARIRRSVTRQDARRRTRLRYAVAVAAHQFLSEGARVTINSNFDISIDGQSGRRFDATSLSYWLRRTPEGQLALERESMQPLLAALED